MHKLPACAFPPRAGKPAALHSLTEAIDDARLAEIVRRHLQLYAVAIGETDEAFPHLARDVGEDEVLIAELYAEHGSCEHGGDSAFSFDNFFCCH